MDELIWVSSQVATSVESEQINSHVILEIQCFKNDRFVFGKKR